jgi:hypothetical protein
MKNPLRSVFVTAILGLAVTSVATAQTTITAIYGSGNPDNGWSAATANNVQLALRAKVRDDGTVPWSAGNNYTFTGGPALSNPLLSSVNWEFSINSDVNGAAVLGLSQLTGFGYQLSVDIDPTAAQSWINFNPFIYADNSLGTDATPNGFGAEDNIYAGRTIAQNSQNMSFLPFGGDPNISGIFDFRLAASTPFESDFENAMVAVQMRVIIGPAVGAVPEPSTYGLIGAAALCGLVVMRRTRAKNAKASAEV